jgi:glutamate racemase
MIETRCLFNRWFARAAVAVVAWLGCTISGSTQELGNKAPHLSSPPTDHAVAKWIEEVQTNRGKGTTYSIPLERYSQPTNELPIGVFDSGIGGLTVLETILTLDEHNNRTGQPGKDGIPDFQNERFLYLGDQVNMPYGNYAAVGKEDLLREFILRDVIFLLGDRFWEKPHSNAPTFSKPPVKAIVIACNTATAYGLEDIRRALREWNVSIPVIGVVEAGANAVVQELPSNGDSGTVAVMATVGTCSSNAYPKAIAKSAGQAGKRQPLVWQQGSLGLAGAIEGSRSFLKDDQPSANPTANQSADYQGPSKSNPKAFIDPNLESVYAFDFTGIVNSSKDSHDVRLNSVENYVRYDVVTMVEGYRRSGAKLPIEKVILGCTHFPFESKRIAENLERLRQYRSSDGTLPYKELISPQVELVDPGVLTAKQLFRTLTLNKLRSQRSDVAMPTIDRMFLSVANPNHSAIQSHGGFSNEYKFGRTAGESRGEDFLVVPLTCETLPASLVPLVSTHCRSIWTDLQRSTTKALEFELQSDRIQIALDREKVGEFVFQDPKVLRPYFSNARSASGIQVTRTHPPIEGKDALDHDTMHPGIWMAFGDISGNDFWRNKALIRHLKFSQSPRVASGELQFATESELVGNDGMMLATCTNKIRCITRPAGWMVLWEATFRATTDVAFGDQEEMGFGTRVATELTEKNGGIVLNSEGQRTAAKTWGQKAVWCDYSGKSSGKDVGILIMASPSNFREPWWHNRNYGLMLSNPFGRKAMKQGDSSSLSVKKGESLSLTFGAMIHEGPDVDPKAEYDFFLNATEPKTQTSTR